VSWQIGACGSDSEASMENTRVRHILMTRLREGTSPERFLAVAEAFREMAGKIEGIVGFEYGLNNSAEGKNHGLTHIITLTFASAEARDAYLPHPQHLQFAHWVGQQDMIEELLVFDYTPLS
jgi:hypothetical protein